MRYSSTAQGRVSGEYEIWPSMQSFADVVDITDWIKLKRGAIEVYAKNSQRYLRPDALSPQQVQEVLD
jgi:hypothetical protein